MLVQTALVHRGTGLTVHHHVTAAAGAVTYPVCPVCEKPHSFGRFPHFRGVPEKSGRSTSPLSDLNDRPFGLLWPETGDENRGGRLIILYRVPCKRFQDSLDVNSLDLIKRQLLVYAVIELRGAGRLVTGDAGGGFQITPVAQVLGDAGPPETVIRDFIG